MSTKIEWVQGANGERGSVERRPIAGFPGYYVGADGSVWSRWKHNGHQARVIGDEYKRLMSQADHDGYLALNLYVGGKARRRKVHLLVIEAFVGPRPPGMQACHINGVVSDCSATNLRWDTPRANQADRLVHGTDSRGEKNGNSKLSADQVREIMALLEQGRSCKDVAATFGVSATAISGIKSGRLWGWLQEGASVDG